MFKRELKLELAQGQSAFLWGARQTGKSFFLKHYFKDSAYYDLLDSHEAIRLIKSPFLLREEILALPPETLQLPIILDEVEKVPELLNEVHLMIENFHFQFILCSSSARKLKTRSTNLLGGRAWQYNLYPLLSREISNFDLLRALIHGLVPKHYLAETKHINDYFQAYVDIYLTDEIRNEGLVRNLPAFARFLDVVNISNGEMINASSIARDCGVSRVTVQEYYQILVDTHLGYYIYPFTKVVKRDLIEVTPKFYLFDVGVANYLGKRMVTALKGDVAGKSFEHFILLELIAFRSYCKKQFNITYWRTKTGLEVDFILANGSVAIETKISEEVHQGELKGLLAFCEEHSKAKAFVVSQDKRARQLKINDRLTVTILPWKVFLHKLWQGEVFN